MNDFQKELEALLNRHCQENASNTPDFILAEYLTACLHVWNGAVVRRAEWYGRMDRPGGPVFQGVSPSRKLPRPKPEEIVAWLQDCRDPVEWFKKSKGGPIEFREEAIRLVNNLAQLQDTLHANKPYCHPTLWGILSRNLDPDPRTSKEPEITFKEVPPTPEPIEISSPVRTPVKELLSYLENEVWPYADALKPGVASCFNEIRRIVQAYGRTSAWVWDLFTTKRWDSNITRTVVVESVVNLLNSEYENEGPGNTPQKP